MKCLILLLSLVLTMSCEKFAPEESTADKAQRMLDERNYSGVINYLERRQLNSNTSDILVDAYIGASGFETIPFLEQVELVLSNSLRSEHPVEFLHESFRPIKKLHEHHKRYLKKAIELTIHRSNMANFKMGIVNLYQAVHILKTIGEDFRLKLQYDSLNRKVLVLSEEEQMELMMRIDQLIGAVFRTYAHFRDSFDQINNYFSAIDHALERLFGVAIQEIGNLKDLNIEKALRLFLKNNPAVVKRLAFWITKECETQKGLKELIRVRDQIKSKKEYKHLVGLINSLIAQTKKLEDRICDNKTIYSSTFY